MIVMRRGLSDESSSVWACVESSPMLATSFLLCVGKRRGGFLRGSCWKLIWGTPAHSINYRKRTLHRSTITLHTQSIQTCSASQTRLPADGVRNSLDSAS